MLRSNRSSRGRLIVALGALAVAALASPAAASAAGARYTVLQCHPENLGSADVRVKEPRPYSVNPTCAARGAAMAINSVLRAKRGAEAQLRWRAPADTGLVGVSVAARLRRDRGHRSRLYLADERGRKTKGIAYGASSPSGFQRKRWRGSRQEQLVAALGCTRRRGCAPSSRAKAWLRKVKLTLADYADPTLAATGPLITAGWKRGARQVGLTSADDGSGLRELVVRVNGSELTRFAGLCPGVIAGSNKASRLRPCATDERQGSVNPSTAELPFHEGTNQVELCAADFAGNEICEQRQVRVDNVAPSLAFTNGQDENDPELIQAPVADSDSGVSSGQIYYRAEGEAIWLPLATTKVAGTLRARVDSVSVPPGLYEFRAVASDVAGNTVETTRRQDGLAKRLMFPLKAGVVLNAHLEPGGGKRVTVGYRRRTRAKGILREASGERLAGQVVVVTEHFGEGALIRERVSRPTTDERGRWSVRLPAGPSRRVTAEYEGSPRYLGKRTLGGRLRVRSKATLRTSRGRVPEGGRVTFRGRIRHRGARIPSGGKLLELQVKQPRGSYQTVGQAFGTRADGSYRTRYRFGRFYAYDVRFKFRVRVLREGGWPYKAPVRSRARKVTVLDR